MISGALLCVNRGKSANGSRHGIGWRFEPENCPITGGPISAGGY
jgi:hypothetical protein